MPLTYSITSILVDKLLLSFMHSRVCIFIGYIVFAFGFAIAGPIRILAPIIPPSLGILAVGLLLMGIGTSLTFVPIFGELISTALDMHEYDRGKINNMVSGMQNFF